MKKHASKIVTVEFEVEVSYEAVRSVVNQDADNRRGMVSVEWIPRDVEVLTTGVPHGAVETFLKQAAVLQFNEKYN